MLRLLHNSLGTKIKRKRLDDFLLAERGNAQLGGEMLFAVHAKREVHDRGRQWGGENLLDSCVHGSCLGERRAPCVW